MARQRPGIGKHHGEGKIRRRPAPELGIDEVGDAPEEETDRHHGGGEIEHAQRRKPAPPCKQPKPGGGADQPAMEGHAALPDRDDVLRPGEIALEVVEQHEAEPPAEHDAEGDEEQHVVELFGFRPGACAPQPVRRDEPARIPPAAEQPHDIGKPVPFDRERPELERDRIDHREGDGEDGHGLGSVGGSR